MMRRRGLSAGVFLAAMVWWGAWALAQEEPVYEKVHDIGEIEVTAERIKHEFTFMPNETVLDLDEYQPMEVPQNIGDYIKDMIIFDFRNESNLVPDDDSFQMRGFEANRFVTSIDGLNLRKTGAGSPATLLTMPICRRFSSRRSRSCRDRIRRCIPPRASGACSI